MNISNTVFTFLNDLEANNNREWFQENKQRWESVKSEFTDFVEILLPELYKIDPSIGIQSASKCMYRIHRDTRFSKDKTPYKTHIAVFMASGGVKQHGRPGYYLHLENNASVIGGGIFMPSPENLDKIRKDIYYNPKAFKDILSSTQFTSYFTGLGDMEKLKMAPKNFPKDFPDIDLLKHKHYSTVHEIPNKKVLDADFNEYILSGFKATLPLNQFLNEAIAD